MLGIEDRLLIQDLCARYCAYVDLSALDHLMDLFTEDAAYESIQCAYGWSNVRQLFKKKFEHTRPERGTKNGLHITSNLIAEGNGDRASALSHIIWAATSTKAPPIETGTEIPYALRFGFEAGQHEIILAGLYQDELRKVQGQWRFAKRKVHYDLPGVDVVPGRI